MRRGFASFGYWIALSVLLLGAVSVGQSQQALVKVICDRDEQEIYLDEEFKTTCDTGEPVRIIVASGEHVVEAKRANEDGSYFYFKKKFKIGAGVQKNIEVKSKISYTPAYYKNKCENGSIHGCFSYLHSVEKDESDYWETARLKYFELLCQKGSVRGCAYLYSVGKASPDEFRKAADRRFARLYTKLPGSAAAGDVGSELLKYKVYLVDPQTYMFDVDPYGNAKDEKTTDKALSEFLSTFVLSGVYYAPVALYLNEEEDRAYYLLEAEGMPEIEMKGLPEGDVRSGQAPASLSISLPTGETSQAKVVTDAEGKLEAYETALIAASLKGGVGKELLNQPHEVVLKGVGDAVLMRRENVLFDKLAIYSEDYLYERATSTKNEAFLRAYLQLYPNGKYAQELERVLDELYWARCTTAEGCRAYLELAEKEPWAKHKQEAYQKLDELYWAQCTTAEGCLHYLAEFPSGPRAKEAKTRFTDYLCRAGSVRACLVAMGQVDLERLRAALAQALGLVGWQGVARHEFSDVVSPPTFSPDGRYLAAVSGDGTLRVYRTSDWREVARHEFGDTVYPPTFSPDGRYLAAVSGDGTLRVYRVSDWREVARHEFGDTVYPPTFSPDGRYLAAGSRDGTLRVYRASGWEEVARYKFGYWVYSPTFSSDGGYLAAGSLDGTLRVYRVSDWREAARYEFGDTVYSPTFSPNGGYLAAGSKDGTLRVYRVPPNLEGSTVYVASRALSARVGGLALAPLALVTAGQESYYLVEVVNESLQPVELKGALTMGLSDSRGAPIAGGIPSVGSGIKLEPSRYAYVAFKLPNEAAAKVRQRIHNVKFTLPDGREVEVKYVIFSKELR